MSVWRRGATGCASIRSASRQRVDDGRDARPARAHRGAARRRASRSAARASRSRDERRRWYRSRDRPGRRSSRVGARAGESLGLALEERSRPATERSGAMRRGDAWRVRARPRDGRRGWPAARGEHRRPAPAHLVARPPAGDRRDHGLCRSDGASQRGRAGARLRSRSSCRESSRASRRRSSISRSPAASGAKASAAADRGLLQALAAGSTFEPAAPTLAPVGFAMPLAVAAGRRRAAPRVQARRACVGEGEPLALALPPGTPITCDVADGGAAVVELEATAGEPVVGFLDGRGTIGPSTAWGSTSGGRVRSAKSAGKGRAVELWNSGASTGRSSAFRLAARRPASAPAPRLGRGRSVGRRARSRCCSNFRRARRTSA